MVRSLIICASVHQGNTQEIAKAMAEYLNADLVRPSEVTAELLSKYKLIGFGSGIYNGKHHQSLLALIKGMPAQKDKQAFIFSTNSVGSGILGKQLHQALRTILKNKGFLVQGEFSCKGFMHYSFTKWFGGINKYHPNAKDSKKAVAFVQGL